MTDLDPQSKSTVCLDCQCVLGGALLCTHQADVNQGKSEVLSCVLLTLDATPQPLMLRTSMEALLAEVHALAYLSLMSNRSLIIPNILIGEPWPL